MGEKKKELTLEEAFVMLEDTVAQLESEEITLEDSFLVYKQGMDMLKFCNDKIDKVEKKILKLNDEGETDEL